MLAALGLVTACPPAPNEVAATESSSDLTTLPTSDATNSTGTQGGEPAVLDAFATAYCKALVACECANVDEPTCVSQIAAENQGLLDAGAAAGLSFDTTCVQARLDRFLQLGCAPDWSAAGPYVQCKTHYGPKPLGEPCTVNDLADGDDCQADLYCWQGTCVELLPDVPAGEACALYWPYCSAGACIYSEAAGAYICQPPSMPGDPCFDGGHCLGLPCSMETGTCVTPLNPGESCVTTDDVCGDGLECVTLDGTDVCAAEPVAGMGESCKAVKCGDGLTCQNNSTCVASPPYVCVFGPIEVPPSPGQLP